MTVDLVTTAERAAAGAGRLQAFSGFDLLHIKRAIAELLSQIGRNGIFDEYTRHDISHVDSMLQMAEWIVPESTRDRMSTTDWLMVVLSAYFHDLGMLVTKREYERRYESLFVQYKETATSAVDDLGRDYAAKVAKLPEADAERFLYQEFVRANHAKRVRAWIQGDELKSLGVADTIVREVRSLLQNLDPTFRDDLGLVCESHHLDDLENVSKYRLSRPYGNTADETANVQYAAVLLRTIDLLHITRDRTPSVVFRLIDPADPMSQQEWAKQMAVRTVRSQFGKDREGNLRENEPRDTVEVHAKFRNESGFFGLTSYLRYAQHQLGMSYKWIQESNRRYESNYRFPWRYIDQGFVEAEGFLPEQFEFKLDQKKILDLLTGHTLYNDTSVVLRELVQNSIDAVRLQYSANGGRITDCPEGLVKISWDSTERILEVWDNGTGMTQEVIETNLLKVGSSRYQEPKFKEMYPEFNPISRFGIGVLSAFMISDAVEIVTCHPEEEHARYLSLRSVHGKYLIRLLNKELDEAAESVLPHGTVVRLTVRESAQIKDIAAIAARWFVLPGCRLSLRVDNEPEKSVGFSSLSDALWEVLAADGVVAEPKGSTMRHPRIDVRENAKDGTTVAYALEWSEYFQEWNFLQAPTYEIQLSSRLGTCVEGIRVDSHTPGFSGKTIYAIANCRGPGAPTTNVARSGFEPTAQYEQFLSAVYEIYCDHVSEEVGKLYQKRKRSPAWAVRETGYLLSSLLPLRRSDARVRNSGLLNEELKNLPTLLLEEDGKRSIASISDIAVKPFYWKVESALIEHAEALLRELPIEASLATLLQNLGEVEVPLPSGTLLCIGPGQGSLQRILEDEWEVSEVIAVPSDRRLDVRLTKRGSDPIWFAEPRFPQDQLWVHELLRLDDVIRSRDYGFRLNTDRLHLPLRPLSMQGFTSEEGVRFGDLVLLFPGRPWSRLVVSDQGPEMQQTSMYVVRWLLSHLCLGAYPKGVTSGQVDKFRRGVWPLVQDSEAAEYINHSQLDSVLEESSWILYDTRRWQRILYSTENPYSVV